MATKPVLSTYSTTPEGQSKVQEYLQAQQRLLDAYEMRNAPIFDPKMLALAQAFATPTKTGSFGEVLGNVAGALSTSQEAESKRAQEIAKMRFELAQQNLMMGRRDEAMRMLAPSAEGMPSGAAPQGAKGAEPQSGAPVQKPAALAGYGHITPELALQISARDPELGKLAMDYIQAVNAQKKLAQEAVRPTEAGTFVIDPSKPGGGTYTPAPGRAYVERFLPGTGSLQLTASDAAKFDEAKDILSKDPTDVQASNEIKRLVSKSRGPSAVLGTGPSTPAEAERQKEEQMIETKGKAEQNVKQRAEFISKGATAGPRKARLSTLETVVSGPNANQYLGVFEDADVASALAKMVEPSVPQIREVFTNYGMKKGVKAEQLFVEQQIALVNLEMRKIMRSPGEGAQSDLENKLALAAGIDVTNPVAGIVPKIKFLRAQADFDKKVANEISKSNMSAEQFVLSDQYDRLLQKYESDLMSILGLKRSEVPSSTRPKPGTYGPARQRLSQELGIRP